MEEQKTPASPPRKVRRIGRASSNEEAQEVPNFFLERTTMDNKCLEKTAEYCHNLNSCGILGSVSDEEAEMDVDMDAMKVETNALQTSLIKGNDNNANSTQDFSDDSTEDMDFQDHFDGSNTSGEVVDQSGPPNQLYCTKETQTDDKNDDEENVGTCMLEDAVYVQHLSKITADLFTNMRAQMRYISDQKKTSAIAQILAPVFFTEKEIYDRFFKKPCMKDDKETQTFGVKRMFLMSQVINFMITEKEDISVKEFKETTKKNNGLQGELYKHFIRSMIKYAECLQDIKQENEAGSSEAVE